MFENDLVTTNHNLFKMAAPCRYIRVHDGKACIKPLVHRLTVQAMDYTYNMKGSLGEALRASLTLAMNYER